MISLFLLSLYSFFQGYYIFHTVPIPSTSTSVNNSSGCHLRVGGIMKNREQEENKGENAEDKGQRAKEKSNVNCRV
jgi:hypothetical protein